MALYDEDDLFNETAMRAATDSYHKQAAERGIKTLQKARLNQITEQSFMARGFIPIIVFEGMFRRILDRLLRLFGINEYE